MAKKNKETKDLAVKEPTSLATASYGDYAMEGFENTSKDDFSIPFILILQQLSPQLDDSDAAHIKGAKQGMLLNTVTSELYDSKEGLFFQPCITQHVFVEWVPRTSGGGFVGIHQIDSKEVQDAKNASTDFGKYKNGENDLMETFYIYGNVLDANDNVVSQAMITFNSTKIKIYKTIMTKLRAFQVPIADGRKVCPPLFAHRLKITSVKQTKDQYKFWNFKIDPAKGNLKDSLIAPDHQLMELGQALHKLVKSGDAKVDHSQGSAADAKKGKSVEEAPF